MLELASERVFVPLTVGGGIRSHTDDSGKVNATLQASMAARVAHTYTAPCTDRFVDVARL